MISEGFECLDHGRVIPLGATMGTTGIEQFLRSRGIWQTHAKSASSRQRQIEVFLVQFDAKPRIKVRLIIRSP